MFETFDAPALHIGVQAVLALYSSWAVAEQRGDAVGAGLEGLMCVSVGGRGPLFPLDAI